MNTFGLLNKETEELRTALAKFPEISKAVIYGSRARGDERVGSDIDLTLMGDNVTHEVLYRLSDEIEELMQPYYMDLTIYNELKNRSLIESIDREGVEFYNKQRKEVAL